MKKVKKLELRLEKEVISALNHAELESVMGGQADPKSDMWVTKDYECRTKYDGCKSMTACLVESVDVCVQTRNVPPCLPVAPLTNLGCPINKPVTVE